MRFMVITKATDASEAGRPATSDDIATMGAFIEEMMNAGVLLAAEGIHPSTKGARIYFDGDTRTVVDGPFTETKELIAGFFLVETKTLDECVAWFKRCPVLRTNGGEPTNIEIRQVISADDLGDSMTPEQRETVAQRDAQAAWPAEQ
ncbi:YciI family protein [Actinoplanes sp. NPDC049265]|uniref:YciI family protein n=1 Tax=Actinoplanes sp. NPDC049265 TaxID=3363902 RepID=UPI00371664E3